MKQAFEENDAGYQYIIDQKGSEAYQIHNSVFEKKIKKIVNSDSCKSAIKDWSKFFRVGHFRFVVNPTLPEKSKPLQEKNTASNNINSSFVQSSTYVRDYDSTTVYFRIQTFDSYHTKEIDSVIHANRSKILSKKNLIIDIRGNGGGTDQSFWNILPIIYTNPIKNVSVEYLSTPHNNKIWEERQQQSGLSESEKARYTDYLKILNAYPGKFVKLFGDSYTTTFDVKYPFPQNVGIIINGDNGSTAEQFLLAAKQSKKVKLFGATTMGELDISNMYSITSPDKKYTLWYCISKSLRIPDNTIDNKGIAPDYYIDKSIPTENWLSYVAEIMKDW